MSEGEESESYPYQLVKFKRNGKEKESCEKEIDIVPSKWITYDIIISSCVTKFPSPPYTDKNFKVLCSMVKDLKDPIDSWLYYPIELRGHAKTYEDALRKVNVLMKKNYAYSTEDEGHAAQLSFLSETVFKKKQNPSKNPLDQILNISCVDENDNEELEESSEDESHTSVSDEQEDNLQHGTQKNRRAKKQNLFSKTKQSFVHQSDSTSSCSKKKNLSTSRKNKKCTLRAISEKHSKSTKQWGVTLSEENNSNIHSTPHIRTSVTNASQHEFNVAEDLEPFEVYSTNAEVVGAIDDTLSILTESIQKPNSDLKELTECVLSLKQDIKNISLDVRDIKRSIENMRIGLEGTNTLVNLRSFAEKYNITLPLKLLEDLNNFNIMLKDDKTFRKDFISSLYSSFDDDMNLTKTITAILKKYLSRDIAVTFNAIKASEKKAIFKDTQFYECMRDAITQNHRSPNGDVVSEKKFNSVLGACFTNAKDWDGFRAIRAKKAAEKRGAQNT